MKAQVNKVFIRIVRDDLLSIESAGIVVTTDVNLTVNSLLAAKAGTSVQRECIQIGWCEVGSAVVTSAGNLATDKIIHAVGPRWGEGSERGKLMNVTLACLRLAEQHRLKSLAIPPISTGALGYPLENCAKTMLTQIVDYTFEDLKHLRHVVVCVDTAQALDVFSNEFAGQLKGLKEAGVGKVKV
jgi:O-acetyl-ADP-ribose deacetylase (regulator of RNase III)